MKVAIASDDRMMISQHFGRTRGFVIAEIDDKNVKNLDYRPNTFTGHARGLEHGEHHVGSQAGHHADHHADHHGPILEALRDCQVVISKGMGRRIYEDLKNSGIQVFVTGEAEVGKAIEMFIQGKLEDRTIMMGGKTCPEHER